MLDFILNNIDVIALVLSIINFLFICYDSSIKLNCKIKFNRFGLTDNNYSYLLFDCEFYNNSKYPITINKIKLNNYNIFHHKVELGSGSEIVFNQEFTDIGYSQEFPFKLDSFDSKISTIMARNESEIKLNHFNLIKIYTSRGIIFYIKFIKKLT